MMSILLLTLLSALQAHPVLISRVSLLPVAYVVVSFVQKEVDEELSAAVVLQTVVLDPDLKSRVKTASVKVPLAVTNGKLMGETVWVPPPVTTLNRLAQSSWDGEHTPVSGAGGHESATLPSSWKSSSWTANAVPA
jgi:hypothetical protein